MNSDDFDAGIFDDSEEDDGSNRDTQDGDDEGELVDSENGEEEDGSDDDDDEGSEQREVAEESDSSEDEVDASFLPTYFPSVFIESIS